MSVTRYLIAVNGEYCSVQCAVLDVDRDLAEKVMEKRKRYIALRLEDRDINDIRYNVGDLVFYEDQDAFDDEFFCDDSDAMSERQREFEEKEFIELPKSLEIPEDLEQGDVEGVYMHFSDDGNHVYWSGCDDNGDFATGYVDVNIFEKKLQS